MLVDGVKVKLVGCLRSVLVALDLKVEIVLVGCVAIVGVVIKCHTIGWVLDI